MSCMTYTAEEIEKLLAAGALMRIGMGSRRACYRLPDGKHCLKCYRSDAEIEEGKYPGTTVVKPLAAGATCEIRHCRFDKRRNTCCQEYRYWLELKKRLPADMMAIFPATMEQVYLPSRGWAIIEELVVNSNGSPILKFTDAWRAASVESRPRLYAMLDALKLKLETCSVRIYDPQTLMVQDADAPGCRMRILDFEPASRNFIPVDDMFPFLARIKVERRFRRYIKMEGFASSSAKPQSPSAAPVNLLCLKWGRYYGPEYVNRLYFGVKRQLGRPFRFVCVTDDPSGLVEGVDAVPFPPPPPGWNAYWPDIFVKLCVFKDGFANLKGPTMFLDIDQVIMGPLDKFFDYRPGEFCIIHNWIEWRKHLFRRRPQVGNSSCFRFEAGRMNYVYEKFLAEQDRALDRSLFRTEQAFMTYAVDLRNVVWWPKKWVASFKRSCTWLFPLNLVFKPRPPRGASILCFHGNPTPQEAIDGFKGKKGHPEQRTLPAPWVKKLWYDSADGGAAR